MRYQKKPERVVPGRFEEMFGDIVGAIQGGCNTLDKLDKKLGDRYGRNAFVLEL